jgi:hypothetical protein
MKTSYRGFEIAVSQSNGWSAKITNSQSGKTWSQGPVTALDAGAGPCVAKAKSLIDAFIALNG